MKTKQCGECKKDRGLSNFSYHGKSKDGLRKTCNICISSRPSTINISNNGVDTYKGQVKKAIERGTIDAEDFSIFVLRSLGIRTDG